MSMQTRITKCYRMVCDGCGKKGGRGWRFEEADALRDAHAESAFRRLEKPIAWMGMQIQDLCADCLARLEREQSKDDTSQF
jgi:hypothetical protein